MRGFLNTPQWDREQQGALTSGRGLSDGGTGWGRLMHQERGAEVATEGGGLRQEGAERGHEDAIAHGVIDLPQLHMGNQP